MQSLYNYHYIIGTNAMILYFSIGLFQIMLQTQRHYTQSFTTMKTSQMDLKC